MKVHELSTPAVVVDLDILDRNLHRMADYCHAHNLGLRPHTKTHKTIEVSNQQLALGALGLTVAKVGEAEVMAATGTKQILVGHPILGDEKLIRLATIAKQLDVVVAVDSLRAAESLSRIASQEQCSFGIVVEFDSGSLRCGVPAGQPVADLGAAIAKLPHLSLRGVFTYFGSVWGDDEHRRSEFQKAKDDVAKTLAAFERASLPLEIVSVGSTPAAEMSHHIPGITEIRPGTYVYNDLNTFYQGLCTLDDCAVRVVTTVVSTAVPGHVIIDAGSKTFSSDALGAGPKRGFGMVMEAAATVAKMNEEHGFIGADDLSAFEVGQVLTIIPNHVCTCINMHDEVFLSRSGEIVGTMKIAARGKVR